MKKRTSQKVISVNSKQRALQQRFRSTEEFSRLTKIRNGVETVPSYLRRAHNVDRMPVRGLKRCKLFFGLKIGGSNIKKFCKYIIEVVFKIDLAKYSVVIVRNFISKSKDGNLFSYFRRSYHYNSKNKYLMGEH